MGRVLLEVSCIRVLADGDSLRRRRGFKRPGWTARAAGPYIIMCHVTENRPGARVWRGVTATSYARADAG